MRAALERRGDGVIAVIGGAWAFAFLRSADQAAAVVLGLLVALTLLLAHRRPAASGLAVAALITVGHLVYSVPAENAWPLAPALIALYAVGRHGGARAALPVLVALWAAFVALDPTIATAVFAGVLVGAPFALGSVLRCRTDRATRAGQQAAALARVDPDARAQHVVAEERARLAAHVLEVIRTAVGSMQAGATRAQDDLDPAVLTAIQDDGRQATGELRRLLGLLRSESPAEAVPGAPADVPPVRLWPVDVLVATALAALYALETIAAGNAGGVAVDPLLVLSGSWLVAAVAMRRTRPASACLLAAVTPVSALVLDLHLGYGLWSAAATALLVLSATARGGRLAFVALGAFVGAFLVDVLRHEPENAAITLATVVLAGLVGHGWGDRARAEEAAQAASAALRAEHDAVAARALRADRLKLARELHDITSHAVGVMVLQAGAAAALRDRDPERARHAIRIIRSTAAEALSQVGGLLELLDAGTVGSPGFAGELPAADLDEALSALADRVRGSGVRVTLDISEVPANDRTVVATAYRVVQESLTNAMRHAPGSAVHVRVHHHAGDLAVSVHDYGAARAPAGEPHAGFGLVGLAERVAAVGGEIRTGPRAEGGFEVHAVLPVGGPVVH